MKVARILHRSRGMLFVASCLFIGCIKTRNFEIYNHTGEQIKIEIDVFFSEDLPKQDIEYSKIPSDWIKINKHRYDGDDSGHVINAYGEFESSYYHAYEHVVKFYIEGQLLGEIVLNHYSDTEIYIDIDKNGKIQAHK
ncbi:MAG TPA: hypothetical protein PLI51_03600 [bacterium]|nr:hypothetical protein [bacterium]